MSNVLVAFFSASGVTAEVAKSIAAGENADLFEIRPVEPYTAADLDWTNKESRSTVEMSDPDCRPAVAEKVADMDKYDAVFVGFPIWWQREPSVVDTFLDSYDFKGKTIIPFCTSGGNGIGNTAERISGIVGEGVKVDTGKRLGGEISESDLKLWMEGLGI
ncbi:MAG: flavodoxin [Eubacterium sp.]|nr:flavodoxin [Eubacterium sp.]